MQFGNDFWTPLIGSLGVAAGGGLVWLIKRGFANWREARAIQKAIEDERLQGPHTPSDEPKKRPFQRQDGFDRHRR